MALLYSTMQPFFCKRYPEMVFGTANNCKLTFAGEETSIVEC